MISFNVPLTTWSCLWPAVVQDFEAIAQQITIDAGDIEAFLNITIIDDDNQEDIEFFTVLISTFGMVTPPGVTIGTPNPAIVEIIDNDGK